MEAVSYGSVYVAQVAMGGNDMPRVKAFQEAEAHDGPSIIIAYSSCIAHGYDLVHGWSSRSWPCSPATGR
jgi:pyruvate-ferredoxin/flavodoxin oxidoreductase